MVRGMVARLTYSRLGKTYAFRLVPLAALAMAAGFPQSGSYVIPGLTAMDGTPKTTLKTSLSLTAGCFPRFSPEKITIPPCSMGSRPVFAQMGGCHD